MSLADVLARLRSLLRRRETSPARLSPERWEAVTRIIGGAVKRPDPRERYRYLDEACRGDRALRREVERLLRFADTDTGVLAGPILGPSVVPSRFPQGDDTPRPPFLKRDSEASPFLKEGAEVLREGEKIGPYRVVRALGDGGMGIVVLVSDPKLGRRVALKLLRHEMATPDLLRRFDGERRIVARLDHPSIVGILDAGEVEGLPYFTMEHVDGEPIDVYCDRRYLTIEARLELVLKVCDALEHAHRNLVVHRDLKPGNILVTIAGEHSAGGEVRLLDFGIAKALAPTPDRSEGKPSAPPLTRSGRQPFTLAYASPEQVRGQSITTASDVYSLGVLVYELLCGHPPYVLDGDWLENAHKICKEVPPPSSSRAVVAREVWRDGQPTWISPDEIARLRSSEPRPTVKRGGQKLRRRLRGDLDSIVLKALAADPEQRYRSMEQLSEDLRRHLAGRPVLARQATFGYRAGKFVLRHRQRLTAAALAMAALLGAITMWLRSVRAVSVLASEQRRTATEARAAEHQSVVLTDFTRDLLWDLTRERPLNASEVLDRAEARVRQELGDEPEIFAQEVEAVGLAHQRLAHYDKARELLTESLLFRRRVYVGDHPLTARSLNNLGALEHEAGDLARAERLYRLALAMRRRLGEDEEDVAKVVSNLASILLHRGELDEAEELYRRMLEIRVRVYGPGHEDVATTLRSLGTLMYLQSDFAAAEPLLRRSLAIRRTRYGKRSLQAAAVLSSLGRVLHGHGRHEEAEAALSEALSIRERRLGDAHPHVAVSRKDLAVLFFDLGEDATAEVLWNRAMAVLRETKAPGSWEIAVAESHLGARLAAQGRVAEAQVCLARSHETLRRLRGEEVIFTRVARRRLEAISPAEAKPVQPPYKDGSLQDGSPGRSDPSKPRL